MFRAKVQGKEYTFAFGHNKNTRHLWGTGSTVVYVSHGQDMASEIAYCSHKDEFDDERGEKEVLKKFMKMMPWRGRDRKIVWGAYHHWKWEQYEKMLNGPAGIVEALCYRG